MQTRLQSLVEQILNIGSGFFVAMLVWEFIITPVWGITTNFNENLQIVATFTAVSIARSYTWRRFFNRLNNNKNKASHEPTDRSGR